MGVAEPAGKLPPAQRIRKRSEFQAVQARGKRVVTPHFVFLLHASAARGEVTARLGITASRKVGGAVVRNRAKRLIREAFRATRPMWKPGIDVVVIVRRAPLALKLGDIVAEWVSARSAIDSRSNSVRRAVLGVQE